MQGQEMKHPCPDCLEVGGKYYCDMNCGPADAKIKFEVQVPMRFDLDPTAKGCAVFPEEISIAKARRLFPTSSALDNAVTSRDLIAIMNAMRLAYDAHQGQQDKGGDPYIWHPLRVGFSLLPDVDACILGILHDVREDGHVTEEQLMLALGGNQDLEFALGTLTRGDEPYEQYIQDCARTSLTTRVKLADLRDNLNPLRIEKAGSRWGAEKMFALRNRYQAAVSILER
jgi:hypothetical protein